ncbi:conserved Plasmodium protein, unknown function [Plasmodium sp. gorilla clade G3]|nr:conserved Plasmodium protein, unknown function [Plasmodium sp. gorilla clade G3]
MIRNILRDKSVRNDGWFVSKCRKIRRVHNKAGGDEKNLVVIKLLEKYKSLRTEDKMKLINSHLVNIKEKDVNDIIYTFCKKKEEEKEVEDEYIKRKRLKLLKLRKPAYLQQKKIKKRVNNDFTMPNEYEEKMCMEKEKELKDIEKYTLIEDMYKSYIYSIAFTLLNNQYKTKHCITNNFVHVMINTIRNEILQKIRPTLINEFSIYKNPYMLLKNAMFNFILHQYVKNPYEESLIDSYINEKIYMNILKINSASVPVEVYEPLVAFRGDVNYYYDLKEKFNDIIDTSQNIINILTKKNMDDKQKEYHNNDNKYDYTSSKDSTMKEEQLDSIINEILKILPENIKYHYENYPFENLKSFKSKKKKKYVGGIKNNKPVNIEDEELSIMRYPNLQCVAHSLPKDEKYRDNVIHAIKVLERSKHWDHQSKIKAVNTLIQVWNNMNSSDYYENILDKSLPVLYTKNLLRKTKTRKDTYNKGLTYIQSLTTQKPLAMRLKKN